MQDTTAGIGRPRRTQEERSAETRDRVIQAAIACIAEEGFGRATTTRMARRAGVTWGAIQHQFGDKTSILVAVLEHAQCQMIRELGEIQREHESLHDRIHAFIECTWRAFNRPSYRAFLEIALGTRDSSGASAPSHHVGESTRVLNGIWRDLFGSVGVSNRSLLMAQRIAFGTLSGMAIEALLRPDAPAFDNELAVLEDTLVRLLSN